MTANNAPEDMVRRIVVALGPSVESKSLLDFAADLASALGVSLAGVFVEDTDIAAYAEMPFAREISMSGAGVRDLSRRRMQTYYRAEAERARRAIEAVGARTGSSVPLSCAGAAGNGTCRRGSGMGPDCGFTGPGRLSGRAATTFSAGSAQVRPWGFWLLPVRQ